MVTNVLNIGDVPQAIQLALGPAFLLTGIAGLLNVMTGRLARIIDRGRQLSEGLAPVARDQPHIQRELRQLERRRNVSSAAIAASTFSALSICMVIVTLFVEALLTVPLDWLVGLLFTVGTLSLVVGLGLFLIEVHLATRTIRFRSPVKRSE